MRLRLESSPSTSASERLRFVFVLLVLADRGRTGGPLFTAWPFLLCQGTPVSGVQIRFHIHTPTQHTAGSMPSPVRHDAKTAHTHCSFLVMSMFISRYFSTRLSGNMYFCNTLFSVAARRGRLNEFEPKCRFPLGEHPAGQISRPWYI